MIKTVFERIMTLLQKLLNTIRTKMIKVQTEITNYETTSTTQYKSTLKNAITPVLILARCFALMPVKNITSNDINLINFKWFSIEMVYTLANLSGTLTLIIMNFIRFLAAGIHFGDMVTVFYFTGISLIIILFIRLARKWLDLNKKWLSMEIAMKKYEYQPNLVRRFQRTTIIVMVLALGEHILFILKIYVLTKECENFEKDPVRIYFGAAFSQIFAVSPYALWKAILMEFFNILATFAWNFMDLFLIIMCAAMAERFRQINKRVEKTEIRNEYFWKEIREDYNRLVLLCKSLDDAISHLITLALANDLFFICVQLFNTLKPIEGKIHFIYFVCSFGFLLCRTTAICVYAAWINDESSVVLTALFNIPTELFGTEANRLIQQVSSSPVVITGSNYFSVTRDLCLKVAGAVITFELVLQQIGPAFLNSDDKKGSKAFCLS